MLTKKVNMYGGYLHILGIIHDFKEIAIFTGVYPAYEMKNPL